jgi:hypothetical protein
MMRVARSDAHREPAGHEAPALEHFFDGLRAL